MYLLSTVNTINAVLLAGSNSSFRFNGEMDEKAGISVNDDRPLSSDGSGAAPQRKKPCQSGVLFKDPEIHRQLLSGVGSKPTANESFSTEPEFGDIRTFFEGYPDPFLVSNETGLILFWNSSAEKVFGYSSDEIIGQSIKHLMDPAYHVFHDRVMAKSVKEGYSPSLGQERLLKALCKDGREILVQLKLFRWQAGARLFFGAALRDVSEELSWPKQDVTPTNSEDMLSLEVLIHELRSMVAVGYSAGRLAQHLSQSEALSPGLRQCLEMMIRSSEMMKIVLENSRMTGRPLENPIHEPPSESFSLLERLEYLEDTLNALLTGRAVRLGVNWASDVPNQLVGTFSGIMQALVNLVLNAEKHNREFPLDVKISVELGAKQSSDDQVCLLFSVQDNGNGIEPQDLEQIFEPHVRSTPKPHVSGLGVGLYAVRQLIQQVGGHIWAESEGIGSGATFYFTAFFDIPQTSGKSAK